MRPTLNPFAQPLQPKINLIAIVLASLVVMAPGDAGGGMNALSLVVAALIGGLIDV